jgi:hypothetical protein
MNPYVFTTNWFEFQKPVIEKYFYSSTSKISILEIGCFEGRSTTFYIDNYLSHPESSITCIDPFLPEDATTPLTCDTYKTFLNNISASQHPNKVSLHKELSENILPLLKIQNKKYNYISIDGSHLKEKVLIDTIFSFLLLEDGGIIFFDDYGAEDVKTAVDSFLTCYRDFFTILHSGYHLVLQKIK